MLRLRAIEAHSSFNPLNFLALMGFLRSLQKICKSWIRNLMVQKEIGLPFMTNVPLFYTRF